MRDPRPGDGTRKSPRRLNSSDKLRGGGSSSRSARGNRGWGGRGGAAALAGSGISSVSRHRWAEARVEGSSPRGGWSRRPECPGAGESSWAVSAEVRSPASPSVPPAGARPPFSALDGLGGGGGLSGT